MTLQGALPLGLNLDRQSPECLYKTKSNQTRRQHRNFTAALLFTAINIEGTTPTIHTEVSVDSLLAADADAKSIYFGLGTPGAASVVL